MAKLTVVDSGVMYRNPLPGHEAVSAIYPFILPLSERELFCSFRHGQAMCSRDGMIHLLRSLDGGETWDHEGPLRDRDQDDRHYQYCFGLLTALGSDCCWTKSIPGTANTAWRVRATADWMPGSPTTNWPSGCNRPRPS